MAERVTSRGLMSVEEYLEFEKNSPVKHEYVAGTIHAMVGATKRRNRIALNIATRLIDAARGGSCRIYAMDVKVRVEDVFYYPDVMVACRPENDDPPVEDGDWHQGGSDEGAVPVPRPETRLPLDEVYENL